MVEADDVLNVDCTEEIDEFTNFLNEFEDELKEKPKTGLKTKSKEEEEKKMIVAIKERATQCADEKSKKSVENKDRTFAGW